jgi:hypothetical protein
MYRNTYPQYVIEVPRNHKASVKLATTISTT